MIRNKQNFLTITEFAKICRSTSRTIRLYAQKGLLKPAKVDNSTGYRYYLGEQARDFFRIKLLQTFEIPLSYMKKALRKSTDEDFLNQELNKVGLEIEEKKRKYDFLDRINAFLHNKRSPEKFTNIEYVGPFQVLAIQKQNIEYSNLASIIRELYSLALKNGVSVIDQVIVTYHDPDNYQPKGTSLEIALICTFIPQNCSLPDGVEIKKIDRHRAITYLYEGPYEYLTFVHKKLVYSDYFKQFKLKPYAYDWEIKGGDRNISPYNYLTKVVYPIN